MPVQNTAADLAGSILARELKMTVDLGDEQVAIERMTCWEALSMPFKINVAILAAHGEFNPLPHLGKPLSIALYEHDKFMRHFHGVLTSAELETDSGGGAHYNLLVEPFTDFMSNDSNMAIFQDLSVPDIIKKVFDAASQPDYKFKLNNSHPKRHYCVQYRESDFGFIQRLMEEEGLFYFFEHTATKHTMIICDTPNGPEESKPAKLNFNRSAGSIQGSGAGWRGHDTYYIQDFAERVVSGGVNKVTLRSFDLEKASSYVEGHFFVDPQHPGDHHEEYDYSGDFLDKDRGVALSSLRLQAHQQHRRTYFGGTEAVSLACGTKFELVDHHHKPFNGSYLLASTKHVAATERYRSSHANESLDTFVTFEAVPANVPVHRPRTTSRPIVSGLESAIVSGPAGEEIYTDKYGRVKVRFHWDRAANKGEESTCFIRVAQYGGLGTVTLPRINQEVMVDFLHGDPDQPIVVGWVFNSEQMPVYPLDGDKDKSFKARHVFRGRNYPGGKSKDYKSDGAIEIDTKSPGANEIRLDDKFGEEEVFIHSEKELNIRARRDRTLQVGRNEVQLIGLNRTDEVKQDETTTIGQNQTLTVKGKQKEEIDAEREIEVKATDKLTVGMSQTIQVGDEITITAKNKLTLKVGGSKITMEPESIKIESAKIEIAAQGSAKMTAAKVDVLASGMHTIQGSMVNIN